VAVGYGGREEIADAVRRLLAEYGDKSLELTEAAGLVTPTRSPATCTPPACPTPT
jgi:hypothetical protein